jgi:1-acyl-sn-glycerol-3-phosphate acyltransferase
VPADRDGENDVVRRESSRFYDLVALGLAAYAYAGFRVRPTGAPMELDAGGLLVSSHRSDVDVPLFVATVYRGAHGLWRRNRPIHFAVRDDLFLPGFFAGYPPGVPAAARRALLPVGIGRVLHEWLPCHPIRSATQMRVVELLRDHRDARLEELLPDELLRGFRERGLRPGSRAADALDGRYARLLWRVAGDDELRGPLAEESWRRRAAAATADFRELVELVRGGGTLVIYPEGRPSPDGDLGPMQRGIAALIRRARPGTLRPLAPAYDPLTAGRPYAYMGIGEPVPPPPDDAAVLALLRRTTPLTAGQLVAAGAAERADSEIEAALAEGRPVAPELLDRSRRPARLDEARRAAGKAPLERLVREYRSARA